MLKLFVLRTLTHAGVVAPLTTRDGKVSVVLQYQPPWQTVEADGSLQWAAAEAASVARATSDLNIVRRVPRALNNWGRWRVQRTLVRLLSSSSMFIRAWRKHRPTTMLRSRQRVPSTISGTDQ